MSSEYGDKYERAAFFRAFLDEHPEFYRRFEREALRIHARGFKHYSAYTIVHVMRHETALQMGPDHVWKINNNLVPTLVRDFLDDHPELEGFLETREAVVVPRAGQPRLL